MIFASFRFLYIRPSSGGNTNTQVIIDLDFRSLYQINPDHLVVLGYASVSGMRKDVTGATLTGPETVQARLIGNFNETFNVLAVVNAPRVGDDIIPFNGIAFNQGAPFVAPPNAQILMPPTFQLEINPSNSFGTGTGDTWKVIFSIGYEIVQKNTRF